MSRRNVLSEKFISFSIIFGFWTDFFWPWVGSFSAGCQNCNLLVHNKSLRKQILFWKIGFFQHSWSSGGKCWTSCEKFPTVLWKLFLPSPEEIFEENPTFITFRFRTNFFDFRRKNSGIVVKIALYVSEGNFCGIFSLDSNILKPFWILAKSSWQVFKVAISMSTGISWRKCFFHAKIYPFCITCGIWSEKTSKSGEVLSAGFSKLHSTLPVESLWANQVSKKFLYFFIFAIWTICFFCQKNWGSVVKTVF